MPAEPAVADFFGLIQKSGIVPQAQWESLIEEYGARADADTPEKIADDLVARNVLTRWQANKLLQGKHKGFILGSYRIMRPLGQGGMGTVYLAQHCVMRRYCAIKVLPTKSSKDDLSMLDRFYRESQAVAALDHPNIVRAYDVNKDEQRGTVVHYLVMEYVEGEDLQAKVQQRGVLGFREAAEYIRQAAEGLAHAHEAGLVHRDVKPANLIVDGRGVIKILDLGLARFYDDNEGASLTNQFGDTVLGTVDYLAPEQAIDCHDADARSDVYSLGQTFYFLLTGHPPFPEGSVAQRLMAHQTREPEPIEHTRPDVPRELAAIIAIMTAKNPDDRYQTAGEVAEALRAWLSGGPSESGFWRAITPQRSPRPASKSGPTRAIPRNVRAPARPEPTRARSSSLEDTELELAPLHDEPLAPSPSASGSGVIHEGGEEPSAADSASKAPAEAAAPSPAPESPPEEPEEASAPELDADMADLSPPQDDWMSNLLDDAVLAEASDAAPVVLPSLNRPAAKKDDETPPEGLFTKPAFWVGAVVAGAALVAVVLGLLLRGGGAGQTASSRLAAPPSRTQSPPPDSEAALEAPDEETARPHDSPQPEQPGETSAAESLVGTLEAPAPVPVDGPAREQAEPRPEEPESARPAPSPEKTRPIADLVGSVWPSSREQAGDRPSGEVAPVGPDGIAQDGPASARDRRSRTDQGLLGIAEQEEHDVGRRTLPEPADATPPEPDPADATPPEPDPAELRARLAAISELSFQLKSIDKSPQSKINMLIGQLAIRAVERAGLTYVKGDAPVMHLTLEAADADGLVGLVLSAELKCRDPEFQELTLWEHKAEVATVAPHLLRRPAVPAPLRTGIGDFFDRFVSDYRAARVAQDEEGPTDPDSPR